MKKYNQYTAIYTDGSKEQEKTACAFVTAKHVSTYSLPDESDIIEAELQAIVMAGQHLVDHPEIKKQFYLQTLLQRSISSAHRNNMTMHCILMKLC